MELGYAFFVLFLYVVLVTTGIYLYEYWERYQEWKKPVKLPMLTERQKRRKLNDLAKPFGFAYDEGQDIFYSRMDGWQRKCGYGRIYDEGAALLHMIFDCEPICFSYAGRIWMIAFWKGQYGVATGGEVGVYYLEKENITEELLFPESVYQCVEDEDTLRIQISLWKNGRQLYYRRGYHWWLTGFVLGEFSNPKDLKMDIEITLKDCGMRDAFLQGLQRTGYTKEELRIQGNTVWIHFVKPHSPQPVTRTRWLSAIKQLENKRNCRLYQKLTRNYANAYDKMLILQMRMPQLYAQLGYFARARFSQEKEYIL